MKVQSKFLFSPFFVALPGFLLLFGFGYFERFSFYCELLNVVVPFCLVGSTDW